MDHAEVIERLEAAFTGPGKLAALEADHSIEGQALRQHLAECPECEAEARALLVTAQALDIATPETLTAPPEARARVLAFVAANGVPRGADAPSFAEQAAPRSSGGSVPEPSSTEAGPGTAEATPAIRRGRRPADLRLVPDRPSPPERVLRFRWLAFAAAVIVALFVTGALLGPLLGLVPENGPEDDLARAVRLTARILQQPGHVQATLRTPAGDPGGSVLVDPATSELVVLSSGLTPVSGHRYDCYVVRDAVRTRIGWMHFENDLAYWSGVVDTPAGTGINGDAFQVVLDDGSGTVALSGTF